MKGVGGLVKCDRGELIDDAELASALTSVQVAGAALAVFTQEPPKENPPLTAPNVIATPHIAGSTNEAQEAVGVQIAQQVKEYLKRGVIQNAVNVPSVTDEEYAEMHPYIEMAEKLGAFIAQVVDTDANLEEIGLEFSGKMADWKTALIRNAAVKGILNQRVPEKANLVNAASVAAERGIQVVETKKPDTAANLLSIILKTTTGET